MGKRKLITALTAACLYATTFIAGNAIAATTADHSKEIIGYVPNWQAWKKTTDGVLADGILNQANIDYSKYTILNFSFFGVANDGSLHSGDYRSKTIYQNGVTQAPAPLLHEDAYSSWDTIILFGEDLSDKMYKDVWTITPEAAEAGYTTEDWRTWTNTITGETGSFPIKLLIPGAPTGSKGLFDLAHENGKKVMASIGGWSMCKHFPEMAADPAKRAKFMVDVKRLIDMGFDGIDLDWEYPGSGGMNIENYSEADYDNFLTLVKEIRQTIGPDKLITAAFYQAESKLAGFNWVELDKYMDHYNMMTYDSNGGWSNIAGHNSPTSAYTGQEWNMNYDATLAYLKKAGVDLNKVNMGVPFYGRGVVTDGPAALNAPTVKSAKTVQPDGPITTAADFESWGKYDGTPTYYLIKQKMGDWTKHWDSEAKVPYLTKGNRFLSYDDEKSIGIKAQFINDNGIGGAIVWDVFGDVECSSLAANSTEKVPVCADLKNPLLDEMNRVFAEGGTPGPKPPKVSASAPASVKEGQPVTITASASDADGTVKSVSFSDASGVIETDLTAPYAVTLNNLAVGTYSITVTATDNDNLTAKTVVNFEVTPDIVVDNPPAVSGLAPAGDVLQKALTPITVSVTATDDKGVAGVTINGVAATKAGDVYSASITPTAFGALNIVAVATDSAGQTAELTGAINVVEDFGSNVDPWKPGTIYTGGDIVIVDGKCYRAKWWTNGEVPGESPWGPWEEVPCP